MEANTKAMILGWLTQHNGDIEGLARWMSRSLRVGRLCECRDLINQAKA